MKLQYAGIFALVVPWTQAWILEDSCEDYIGPVTESMEKAFKWMQAALDTLNNLAVGGDPDDPMYAARLDLFEYMFAAGFDDTYPMKRVVNSQSYIFKTIEDVYLQALGFNKDGDYLPSSMPEWPARLPNDDFIAYCNYDRLVVGERCDGTVDAEMACDLDTNSDMVYERDEELCMYPEKRTADDGDGITYAWSISNVKTNQIGQLQMCDWILHEEYSLKYDLEDVFSELAILSRDPDSVRQLVQNDAKGFKDIELIGLFAEGTILHELTHLIRRRPTIDIEDNYSYGWENCLRYSPYGSDPAWNIYDAAPELNADNYVYFAIGSALILAEAPQRVNADGTISIINISGKHRREKMQDSAQPLSVSTPGGDLQSSYSLHASPSPSPSPSERIQPASSLRSSSTTPLALNSEPSSSSDHPTPTRHTTGLSSPKNTKPSIVPSTTHVSPLHSPARPTQSSDRGTSISSPEKAASTTNYTPSAHLSPARPTYTSDRGGSSSSEQVVSPTKDVPSHSSPARPTKGGLTVTTPSPEHAPSTSHSSSSHSSPEKPTKGLSTPSPDHATSASSDMSTTITSSSSSSATPSIMVITVSSSGEVSSVTYTSTYTSSGSIGPTPAWMCVGPLCDSGGGCLIPIFCAARGGAGAIGGIGSSWGLCCGWEPSVSYGNSPGGPPAPGLQDHGSSLGDAGGSNKDNGNDNEPDDSKTSKTHTSTTTSRPTSTTSSKPTSTTTSKSSSTSARPSRQTSTTSGHSTSNEHSQSSCTQTSTASSCGVTVLKFTPAGAKSATTSTFTQNCVTSQGCQVSETASTSTSTDNTDVFTPTLNAPNGRGTAAWQSAYSVYSILEVKYGHLPSSSGAVRVNPASAASSSTAKLRGTVSAHKPAFVPPTHKPVAFTPSKTTTTSERSTKTSAATTTATKSEDKNSPHITSCDIATRGAAPRTAFCACNGGVEASIGSFVGSNKLTTYTCKAGTLTITAATTAPPTNVPGKGGLPGCSSVKAEPGTSAYCDCDGVTAPPLKPTKSNAINCDYTIQPTKGYNPAEPKTKTTTHNTHPPVLPYASGKCNVHVLQGLGQQLSDPVMYLVANITDAHGSLIAHNKSKLDWAQTLTAEGELSAPLSVTPLSGNKDSSFCGVSCVRYICSHRLCQQGAIEFKYKSQAWNSTSSQCSVGAWDNGDFADVMGELVFGDDFVPNRQMDCKFDCPG